MGGQHNHCQATSPGDHQSQALPDYRDEPSLGWLLFTTLSGAKQGGGMDPPTPTFAVHPQARPGDLNPSSLSDRFQKQNGRN
jgi:hypothetical protein